MFAGIQEILVLIIVILAIFLAPRLLSRDGASETNEPSVPRMLSALTGRLRLALVVSLVWPLLVAGYYEPWETGFATFIYVGIGPVILGWSIRWVIAGFLRNKK
jgi:hypothetical protein